MTVAHDAQTRFPATDGPSGTNSVDTTAGDRTFTHTPAGTPKGAIVVVFNGGANANPLTGVLYGGTAMALAISIGEATEAGWVGVYFLGDLTGLTGAQTVTLQGASTAAKWVTCSTVTAATDQTKVDDTTTTTSTSGADPTCTMTTDQPTLSYGGCHSGAAAPPNVVKTGCTLQHQNDYGAKAASTLRRTSQDAAGAPIIGYTLAADDYAMCAVSIQEYTPKNAPPSYTYYEPTAGWHTTTSPLVSPTASWQAGDYVYVFGATGGNNTTLSTPTHSGANLGTFAAVGTNPTGGASNCLNYVWRAGPATGSGSSTISVTGSGPDERGYGVLVVHGSDEAATKITGIDGARPLSVTRQEAHSLIVYLGADFSAGAAPTTYTPSGQTVEESSQSAGQYTLALLTWNDQAIGGPTSYGPSDGFSGTVTKVALEIFGTVSTGTDLVIANIAQARTEDAPTLVQQHNLAVANIAQARTEDNVVLTVPGVDLVIAAIAQARSSDNVALTQVHILAVAAIAQARAEANVALTQVHVLALANVGQARSMDTPTLTQVHNLAVAALAQARTADNVALTLGGVTLAPADVAVARAEATPTLTQVHVLAVADIAQGRSEAQPTLTQVHQLIVAALAQARSEANVALTQVHQLVVAGIGQARQLENVVLSSIPTLSPANVAVARSADGLVLAQQHTLAIAAAAVARSMGAPVLGQLHLLVIQPLAVARAMGNVTFPPPIVPGLLVITEAPVPGLLVSASAPGLVITEATVDQEVG